MTCRARPVVNADLCPNVHEGEAGLALAGNHLLFLIRRVLDDNGGTPNVDGVGDGRAKLRLRQFF